MLKQHRLNDYREKKENIFSEPKYFLKWPIYLYAFFTNTPLGIYNDVDIQSYTRVSNKKYDKH